MKNILPLFLIFVVTSGIFQAAASVVDSGVGDDPMETSQVFHMVELTDSDSESEDMSLPFYMTESDSDTDRESEEAPQCLDYLQDPVLTFKQKKAITNKIKKIKPEAKEAKILSMQKAYHRKNKKPGFRPEDIKGKKRVARKEKRAKRSPEEKAAYKARKNARQRQWYANLSPEEKAKRKAIAKQRYVNMPAEEKAAYNAKRNADVKTWYANMTAEEKALYKKKNSANQRQWIANMSAEKKAAYRIKRNADKKQWLAKKKRGKEAGTRKQSAPLSPEERTAERVENVLSLQVLRAKKQRELEGLEG